MSDDGLEVEAWRISARGTVAHLIPVHKSETLCGRLVSRGGEQVTGVPFCVRCAGRQAARVVMAR